jgi:hypothetical protein
MVFAAAVNMPLTDIQKVLKALALSGSYTRGTGGIFASIHNLPGEVT